MCCSCLCQEICEYFLEVSNTRRCTFEVVMLYANSSIVFAHVYLLLQLLMYMFSSGPVICNIEVVRLCPSGLLLFPRNEAEWSMFFRNVDSFPFRQISGSRFVHFLAKVMPKFSVNFGMTCATNQDISSARDLPHGEGINVPAKHRPFYVIIHFIRSRIN